jgi:hypothetical protein
MPLPLPWVLALTVPACPGQVRLRYTVFDGFRGAPSQVVAELMEQAYADRVEWLFQLNDVRCRKGSRTRG